MNAWSKIKDTVKRSWQNQEDVDVQRKSGTWMITGHLLGAWYFFYEDHINFSGAGGLSGLKQLATWIFNQVRLMEILKLTSCFIGYDYPVLVIGVLRSFWFSHKSSTGSGLLWTWSSLRRFKGSEVHRIWCMYVFERLKLWTMPSSHKVFLKLKFDLAVMVDFQIQCTSVGGHRYCWRRREVHTENKGRC